MKIATRYTVQVENESGEVIESFVLTGPGVEIELGALKPGEKAREHLHFQGDGAVGVLVQAGKSGDEWHTGRVRHRQSGR